MKILHIHNYHLERGGMEVIYDYTTRLFRDRGHEVIELTRDSADLKSPIDKVGAMASGVYSPAAGRETREIIARHRPDIAYVHNLYPMLSTSVLDACHAGDVPTVMNVQDYKLTCPMGQHLREGKICTKCADGSVAWSAIHACKGGQLTSTAYAITHGITRLRRPYHRGIDRFVTPSRFTANRLTNAGYEKARVDIVPNMCDLSGDNTYSGNAGYAAYVGRLSPEKGVPVLVEAARLSGIETKIAGNGDIAALNAAAPANVEYVGPVSRQAMPAFYQGARFLVVPSIWYEVYAVVLTEAMTMGIPVIASDIGGMPEVFENGKSGLLVPAGDPEALAAAMRRLWDDPTLCLQLGRAARIRAQQLYTPDVFYSKLKRVFERAIEGRREAAVHLNAPINRVTGGAV